MRMEYDVYHDESQENGYWHGILLVPVSSKSLLLDVLSEIRSNTKYDAPVGIKGLNKPSGKPYQTARSFVSFGACALVQRLKGETCGYVTGKIIHDSIGKREFEYKTIKKGIGIKFIVSRIIDHLKSLDSNDFQDHCKKMEVTFRHALKGGIHLLGNQENPIVVRSLHFDGWEQYGRHVSLDNIVLGLNNLRPYCSLSKNIYLEDKTSDHRDNNSQSYEDCQLLQLTDLLIGSFRTILGECKNNIQKNIAIPMEQLVSRWNQGHARMKNSKWYKGFCISECFRENREWRFQQIEVTKNTSEQYTLPIK